jgi:hypothetical protein
MSSMHHHLHPEARPPVQVQPVASCQEDELVQVEELSGTDLGHAHVQAVEIPQYAGVTGKHTSRTPTEVGWRNKQLRPHMFLTSCRKDGLLAPTDELLETVLPLLPLVTLALLPPMLLLPEADVLPPAPAVRGTCCWT